MSLRARATHEDVLAEKEERAAACIGTAIRLHEQLGVLYSDMHLLLEHGYVLTDYREGEGLGLYFIDSRSARMTNSKAGLSVLRPGLGEGPQHPMAPEGWRWVAFDDLAHLGRILSEVPDCIPTSPAPVPRGAV